MICPKCTEKMSVVDDDGIHARSCLYCDGVWVTEQTLLQLLNSEGKEISIKNGLKSHPLLEEGNIHCPTCENQKLRIIRTHDIEIDVCPNCFGVFFDKGELSAVIPPKKTDITPDEVECITLEALIWLLIGWMS